MVFSMRVQCENCPNTYDMKPHKRKRMNVQTLLLLPQKPWLPMFGKTRKGEKCKSIRAFGSHFCNTHKQKPLRRHSQVWCTWERKWRFHFWRNQNELGDQQRTFGWIERKVSGSWRPGWKGRNQLLGRSLCSGKLPSIELDGVQIEEE